MAQDVNSQCDTIFEAPAKYGWIGVGQPNYATKDFLKFWPMRAYCGTPLILACSIRERDDTCIPRLLLTKGADPNIQATSRDFVTLLIGAVEGHNLHTIRLLLNSGADPNI